MDESSKSRRVETREFWEAAIRLWTESGLPVREFCNREGLTEHTFYSWRRELVPKSPSPKVSQEPSATEGRESPADGRQRHRPKPVANPAGTAVEFLPVRVVGDEGLRAHTASAETATGAAPIEIVGTSPWRVRILTGFDPATLDAVLTVLERRPC
jgi:transposase-like protein